METFDPRAIAPCSYSALTISRGGKGRAGSICMQCTLGVEYSLIPHFFLQVYRVRMYKIVDIFLEYLDHHPWIFVSEIYETGCIEIPHCIKKMKYRKRKK